VRGCSPDDSRLGWLTVRHRRLTAYGGPPVGAVQHVFAWCASAGAVAPTPGERFCLDVPSLHAQTVQLFVEALAATVADRWNRLRLDNRGAHTAPRLRWPANVRCVWLPPDGPEWPPIERRWRDRKDDLAWPQCPHVEAQQDDVGQL
jgi:hypothetical protein